MKLTLDKEQTEAVEGMVEHLRNGRGVKTLSAAAGCGKTTLLIEVYKHHPDAIFLVPTHKAGKVLFSKLMTAATPDNPPIVQTTTSFLRRYKGTRGELLKQRIEMLELDGNKFSGELIKAKKMLQRIIDKGRAQEPVFMDNLDAEGDKVICDESSMIARSDRNELEARVTSVVMIGDHYQIGPVVHQSKQEYEDWFHSAKHDWTLDKVYRNDAGVLTLATMIRDLGDTEKINLEKAIRDLNLPDLTVINRGPVILKKLARQDFVALAFMNKTVDSIAFGARKALERQVNVVTPEDRLFASNNFDEITNKTDLVVDKTHKLFFDKPSFFQVKDIDTGKVYEAMVNPARMLDDISESERRKRSSDKGLILRYGLAKTCHGAQGSEYSYVLMVDDMTQQSWMENETHNRLTYTAVTRAQKSFALLK